ncbi:hypothetical protein DND90_15495 [Pseudomonas syringae pv. maculicola]|nr:hypothetical protein DND90_15495 [Pseudomonas syringae pv. maculicola]
MPRDDYRANAPRWHAVRDALRHKFGSHHMFKIGRGASGMAFPRRSVGTIVNLRIKISCQGKAWNQQSSLTNATRSSTRGSGRR